MRDKVIDSRSAKEGTVIRRRRECLECGHRYTTYEEIEREDLRVIKRDGHYDVFDKRKLQGGIERACEKRPISRESILRMIDDILDELTREHGREIPTKAIGEAVMARLRSLDEVAYIRFASVYRKFSEIKEFITEVRNLSLEG
jgi:transcriptional repressor NrdR